MQSTFILSFDYELFGSGKGCLEKHIINPTKKILAVCDKYNVKSTFFIECLELLAFEKALNNNLLPEVEMRKFKQLKKQIIELVQRGHDVQLHLHPQWANAAYVNKAWQLDFSKWRFSSLTEAEQVRLLTSGKAYLEQLIRPYFPDYQCLAFRAGDYRIGTMNKSVSSLKRLGFMFESSICPLLHSQRDPGLMTTSTKAARAHFTPWHVGEHILDKQPEHTGLLEFPLITYQTRNILERISLARVFSRLFNKRYRSFSPSADAVDNSFNSPAVLHSQTHRFENFDVCLSSRTIIKGFKKTIALLQPKTVVLIGHPKDYSCFSPLDRILNNYHNQPFMTFSDAVESFSAGPKI